MNKVRYIREYCGSKLIKGPIWDKESGTWDLIFKERGGTDEVCVPFESQPELRKTMAKLKLKPVK